MGAKLQAAVIDSVGGLPDFDDFDLKTNAVINLSVDTVERVSDE